MRLLLILALLFGGALADSNLRLVTTEYEIVSAELPAAFDGFRIVQLSDLHGAVYGKDNSRLLAAVRAAEPDLIALTGDLADKHTDLSELEPLLTALTELAPTYYVSGNHEWADKRLDALRPMLARCKVRYLRNESLLFERGGASIVLLGVEDPFGPADMPKPDRVADAAPDGFRVMLGHRNDFADKYPDLAVDLLLCGHAHGGIWRLPGVGGLLDHGWKLFPKDVDGVIESGRMRVVVSRGMGNSGGVPRLFNNPELVVAVLKCTEP